MENNKKIPKLGDVDEKELEMHLKLLKKWIVRNNKQEDSEDINIVVNQSNFTRVKIYIDYYELITTCPGVLGEMTNNFPKYAKYLTNATKKILIASKKIPTGTIVFTDIILVNYLFIHNTINRDSFSLMTTQSGVIGFAKAHVIKVNPPTCLLWSKTLRYACICNGDDESFKKTSNIFKLNAPEANMKDSMCMICKKSHIRDKNSEIYIECQEIAFLIDTEQGCLLNNMIKVWAYGDLINTVKEGDAVTLVAYYAPAMSHTYEKNFEYGHFVALNLNMHTDMPNILRQNTKRINALRLMDGGKYNFASKFNEQMEFDILRAVKFQRQTAVNFSKFIYHNFCANSTKGLISPQMFLNIALDLSLVQRDYVYLLKYNDQLPIEKEGTRADLTNSRSLVFKSKIFEAKPKSSADFGKFFRVVKPLASNKTESDYLTEPLNLFLIFDGMKNDKIYQTVLKYASEYNETITRYPSFTNQKNISNFFIRCNNGVVLIHDIDILSKSEIETISAIMNGSHELNISFWFCCGSYKLKTGVSEISIKGFENIISRCEIILNLSKRYNRTRGSQGIHNFWVDVGADAETIEEPTKLSCKQEHLYEDYENSFSAAKLLEDYFITKRDLTNINFNDIFPMLRIATLFSMLRGHYEDKPAQLPCSIAGLNYLDVMMTIFFNEEYAGYKYGLDCASFGNVPSQIIQMNYKAECQSYVHMMKIKGKYDLGGKSKFVPKSRTSFKKIDLMNENIQKDNTKECLECEMLGKMCNGNERIFTFLEKLSGFTYNN